MSNTENTEQFKVGDVVTIKPYVTWNSDAKGDWDGARITRLPNDGSKYYGAINPKGQTGLLHADEMRKPATPTLTALEQRMEDLVRRMAGNSLIGAPYEEGQIVTHSSEHYEEARAILTELEPVDTNLLEARRIVIKACRWFSTGEDQAKIVPHIEAGDWDNAAAGLVQDIVAALRGRALERGE